ncbi:MAG: homogentisate 1,2-dioxygenase, partial [Candidatus Kapaibacterium sp.]
GALPHGQNSPQKCAYGLYAEQLSGSPFTAPRGQNERSWLYRIQPSVKHSGAFSQAAHPFWKAAPCQDDHSLPIGQLRWSPPPFPDGKLTFISGVRTLTTAGDVNTQTGMAAGLYFANTSMVNEYFYNADGELLVVPQEGAVLIFTEFGKIDIAPGEICVIPRGVKFKVELPQGPARGYLCENYGGKFTLPHRGPIGANCLANQRDFKTPVAAFEDKQDKCSLTVKWCGRFFEATIPHSPLDVVAWHGNYAPYKYDLTTFKCINTLNFDHPDPSIYTVLTAPSDTPGTANCDFVIVPDRWMVAEHTFRPPWFHRNFMSEFMGLIWGIYDAKEEGFVPGGCSLHNCMSGHGPDAVTHEKATNANLAPVKQEHTLAFMFETRFAVRTTKHAMNLGELQHEYYEVWQGLSRTFSPPAP